MSAPRHADRNLLFGILALQMDFLGRDDLVAAMHAWVLEKHRPLAELLLERKALSREDHAAVSALVARHLERYPNPEKSLAAVGCPPELRQELERIADPYVSESLTSLATTTDDAWISEAAPTDHGERLRYRILRPHARGGLGEVFVALDSELRREVALKEIQTQHADDPASRARFLLEGEITGNLEHPGIVPVYGLGAYPDGRPFYAMRFIRGESMQEAIKRFHGSGPGDAATRSLQMRQLLSRFLAVCDAIAYAHSRGVIHRDLKPANVMLGEYGETLVVDWGLAKPVGSTDQDTTVAHRPVLPSTTDSTPTQMGQVVGTPAYMSPEQAAGQLDRIGPASDVYSLGATLYTLLTGKAPVPGRDLPEVLRKVQSGEIAPARQVDPHVPAALEAICRKAMAREPGSRYPSAKALREDVDRWLADEPVSAYREGWTAWLARWARRRRTLVGSVATAALAIIAVGSVALVLLGQSRDHALRLAEEMGELAEEKGQLAEEKGQLAENNARLAKQEAKARGDTEKALKREEEERRRAEDQVRRSDRLLHAHSLDLALRDWRQDRGYYARTALLGNRWDLRGWEHGHLRHLFDGQVRVFDVGSQPYLKLMALSANGTRLVVVDSYPYGETPRLEVLVLDPLTGAVLERSGLPVEKNTYPQAVSHNGRRLLRTIQNTLQIVDVRKRRLETTLPGTIWSTAPAAITFSHDDTTIAAIVKAGVQLWEAASGKPGVRLGASESNLACVALSLDGRYVAAGGRRFNPRTKLYDLGVAHVWDVASGKRLTTFDRHLDPVSAIAFRPDGKTVATGSQQGQSGSSSGEVRLWEAATGKETATFRGRMSGVYSLAFSGNGKVLASGHENGLVRVWDPDSGKEEQTLRGLENHVTDLAVSPDGAWLYGIAGRGLSAWPLTRGQGPLVLDVPGQSGPVAFSPDGKEVITSVGRFGAEAFRTPRVCFHDARSGQLLRTLRGHSVDVVHIALSADGRRIASVAGKSHQQFPWPGEVKVHDVRTGRELLHWQGHADHIFTAAFHPDGKRVVTAADRTIKVWDSDTGKTLYTLSENFTLGQGAAFHPDGRTLLTWSDRLRVRDADTGKLLHDLGPLRSLPFAAFTPDGRTLVSGPTPSGEIVVRDGRTWKERLKLRGHERGVQAVAISPDGMRLAVVSFFANVVLWDLSTGEQAFTFDESANSRGVAFSPDGRQIALSRNADVRILESSPGRGELRPTYPTRGLECVAVDAPRRLIAIGDLSGQVRLWDAVRGESRNILHGQQGVVGAVAFRRDGSLLARGTRTGQLTLFDPSTRREVSTWHGHDKGVNGLAFTADGTGLISGGEDRAVKLWDLPSGKLACTLTGHTGAVTSVAVSPGGRWAVSGSEDRTLRLWDLEKSKLARVLSGHEGAVTGAAFSRNGKHLASASLDGTIRLWETASGRMVRVLRGHDGGVACIAFAPDGKHLASGGLDRTLRLWDPETGENVFIRPGHSGPVLALAFDSFSNQLAVALRGAPLSLYDLESLRYEPHDLSSRVTHAFAWRGQAEASLKAGDRDLARLLFQRSTAALEEHCRLEPLDSRSRFALARNHIHLAALAADRGDHAAARDFLESAVAALAAIPEGKRDFVNALLALAEARRRLGAWHLASQEWPGVGDVAACRALLLRGRSPLEYLRRHAAKRLPVWRKAATQGIAPARWLLGLCLEEGIGTVKDEKEAVAWLWKAADQGLDLAEHDLGLHLQRGAESPRETDAAIRWLRRAARQGLAPARFHLAGLLCRQEGQPRAEEEANRLVREAARQGYPPAQFEMARRQVFAFHVGGQVATFVGKRYSKERPGTLAPPDFEEAVRWYRRAAKQGHAPAQTALAVMLIDGRGIPKDEAEGIAWYRQAAAQRYSPACAGLARAYRVGAGTPASSKEALVWAHRAVSNAADARERREGCYTLAETLLASARDLARQGDSSATRAQLAEAIRVGNEILREAPWHIGARAVTAAAWVARAGLEEKAGAAERAAAAYRTASDLGSAQATRALSRLVERGKGVKADAALARRLRERARKQTVFSSLTFAYFRGEDAGGVIAIPLVDEYRGGHPLEEAESWLREEHNAFLSPFIKWEVLHRYEGARKKGESGRDSAAEYLNWFIRKPLE
jgi:WD40 repeat protein/TPR repeat protein/tRNA A-37 threonylcarbamoyl transferase component Bud32